MNKFVLFLITLFLFSNCKNNSDVYLKIINNSQNLQSINYKVTEKYYYLNGADTTITPYEVSVVRDDRDTLKNGYVWVDNNYRPYNMIYDTGNYYLVIPPKNTTILYPNYSNDFISPVDWIGVFLNPDILKGQINSTLNRVVIIDTMFNNEQCSKITIEFPKNKKGEDRTFIYIISNNNLVPLWAKLISKTKDYTYFSELNFSDYEFDNIDINNLREKHKLLLEENPVDIGGSSSETSRLEKMIQIGDNAPLFSGEYLSTGEGFNISDFIGKDIIVIDFWYTHCPPCVKAMPALSELYNQYKNKGLKVFGLNSVDNQPHSLDNLNNFMSKRDISYDIILVEPLVDINYKINGYPSMYIVDKDGNVYFVEIGYDEEKFKIFKNKIEILLDE